MYDAMAGLDLAAGSRDVWDWAWGRHANRLSWYVRPLFLVPLALAAYRRSGWGIVLSIVAMLSSMFWFPAPDAPDAQAREFLRFEQEWLLGSWSLGKAAITSLVPLSLAAYCLAFWRRSLRWGLGVLGAIAMAKLLWGVTFSDSGGAMTVPALVGLLVGSLAISLAVRRRRKATAKPGTVDVTNADGPQCRCEGPRSAES